MTLKDLVPGTQLDIDVKDDERTASFHPTVLDVVADEDIDFLDRLLKPDTDYCIVTPITHDGYFVNFTDPSLFVCRVLGIIDNMPYYWRGSVVVRLQLPVLGDIHLIATQVDGFRFNRRSAYRIWIGVSGTIYVPELNANFDAYIKDVSIQGIGIHLSSAISLQIGQSVTIKLVDEQPGLAPHLFELPITIRRIDPIDERTQSIGGTLHVIKRDYSEYLKRKQHEEIQLRRKTKDAN